jgi:hypothetical protein
MGVRAAAGLSRVSGCEGPGEDTEKVPLLLADDMLPEGLEVCPLPYETPFEYGESCEDGDDDAESVDCACVVKFPPSKSLSDVAVVRLPPDPLRIRAVPLGGFIEGG